MWLTRPLLILILLAVPAYGQLQQPIRNGILQTDLDLGDQNLTFGNCINFGSISGSGGYGICDDGGTLRFKNSGGSWVDLGDGSGDALQAQPLSQFAPTTSAQLKGVLIDELGDTNGKIIFSLGTLAVASGKTLTASNTLNLAGIDGSSLNIGAGGALGSAAFTAASVYAVTGHTHTGSTVSGIDISEDTNLTGTASEVIITGDTLSIHSAITRDSEVWNEQTVADEAFVWTNGKSIVRRTVGLTISRAGLLPATASYNDGRVIEYVDAVSSEDNTVIWSRSGADTLNSGTVQVGIPSKGVTRFEKSGTNWLYLPEPKTAEILQLSTNIVLLQELLNQMTGVGAFVLQSDPLILYPDDPMPANEIDVTKVNNTKTSAGNSYTFTFSAAPASGQRFGLVLTNGDATSDVVTLPANCVSMARDGAALAGFTLPGNGTAKLTFDFNGTSYRVLGEPSALRHGTATLVAGTVTVGDTAVTANTRIIPAGQDNNVTGAVRKSAVSAGTSFTLTSSNAGDSGSVAYILIEP